MKKMILAITIMFACFAIISGPVVIKEAQATIKHRGIKFSSFNSTYNQLAGYYEYKGILEGDQRISGKIFKDGTEFELSHDFKIFRGFLIEGQKVSNLGGGIYYREDYLYSNENGVQCGFLEDEITWKDFTFQSGSKFCFQTIPDCLPECSGQIDVPFSGYLAKDTKIQFDSYSITFAGKLEVTLQEGTKIYFKNDSSGYHSTPISFTPAQDFEYQGVLYPAGEIIQSFLEKLKTPATQNFFY